MNRPEYWSDLTPRQQLNDAVHKFAQATRCTYAEAWKRFELLYSVRNQVDLAELRRRHWLQHGRTPTIPAYLDHIDMIGKAVEVALEMLP
jgi:hypothetical protein